MGFAWADGPGLHWRNVARAAPSLCYTTRPSGCGFHRRHLVGVCLAIFVPNRDIFAGPEGMRPEAITAFIIVFGRLIIVEYPTPVLGASGLMDQIAKLVRLALPEPAHTAMVAMLFPMRRVDMAFTV